MKLAAQPFLWKWVLFAWEWKLISISKAEHLSSFWNRGPRELGNGLFWIHLTNQNSKQVHAAGPKGGKTFWSISETQLLSDPINQSKLKAGACSWRYARENVCKQVTIELLLLLIGWKSGAKCFSQSHYVAIQKQSNSELVSILSNPVVKTQWRLTKLMILSKLNLT